MENNPKNNSYFNTTTGRYLGISDGYFLYGLILIGFIHIVNLVG